MTGISVGCDLVEVCRVKKLTHIDSVFSAEELAYCAGRLERLAACFAVKEAFVKAVKTGFGGIRPLDITLSHEAGGAPYIVLSGRLAERFSDHTFDVSISHDGGFALAVVIAYQEKVER